MHLVFVTPRYGQAIVGGAESAVRSFATRIAARGHEVEVITSTSITLDWEDQLPVGTSLEDGIIVHRLRPRRPRDPQFGLLYRRSLATGYLPDSTAASQFLLDQGPILDELWPLLDRLNPDRVISYPLLYWPNVQAIRWNPARSVLHPAAHPEAILASLAYIDVVPSARRIVLQTHAEQQLVNRLFPLAPTRQLVLGLGREERRYPIASQQLPHRSYLLALGRVQADKGARLLASIYRDARPSLDLILAGPIVEPIDAPPGITLAGIVGDQEREALIANARAVVIASRYESFSLVATEAMNSGVPIIVNGFNPVLVEQVENSGAGVAFRSAAELLGAIELLANDPVLSHSLGSNGLRYVAANLSWDSIIDRYLDFLR